MAIRFRQAVPAPVGQRSATSLSLGEGEGVAQRDQRLGIDMAVRLVGQVARVGAQRSVGPRQGGHAVPATGAAARSRSSTRLHQATEDGESARGPSTDDHDGGISASGDQQRARRRGDESRVGADRPLQARPETPRGHHTHVSTSAVRRRHDAPSSTAAPIASGYRDTSGSRPRGLSCSAVAPAIAAAPAAAVAAPAEPQCSAAPGDEQHAQQTADDRADVGQRDTAARAGP